MLRLAAIAGAILLAMLAYQTHQRKTAERENARLEQANANLNATLATERDDRRLSDATIDRLVKDLDAARAQPPIAGVRCRTARLPTEGGSAGTPHAPTPGAVEGLPAGDIGGGESFGPEIDVSAGLDWYAGKCAEQAIEQASLQGWEARRAH